MPQVLNLQRKITVDLSALRDILDALGELSEARGREFSVALISDRRMKELNSFFRGKNSTTDVLSFRHEPDEFETKSYAFTREAPEGATLTYLGDIVVSLEQAQKQAAENGLSLEDETKQLILHGLLHLCGYDHETDSGEMNKRELRLRRQLGI